MALSARQITLVASTITPLLVFGTGTGTTFKSISGSVQDPLPVRLRNQDASVTIWIGGPDVSASLGTSLKAGETMTMNLYGGSSPSVTSEIPYAFSTGTPVIEVLLGRQ
jgi:hypothetical protein